MYWVHPPIVNHLTHTPLPSSLAPQKIHGSFQSPSRSADQGTLAELTHNARNATHTPAQHSEAQHTHSAAVGPTRSLPTYLLLDTFFSLPHTLFSHSLASRIVGRSVHSTPNSHQPTTLLRNIFPRHPEPHRSPPSRDYVVRFAEIISIFPPRALKTTAGSGSLSRHQDDRRLSHPDPPIPPAARVPASRPLPGLPLLTSLAAQSSLLISAPHLGQTSKELCRLVWHFNAYPTASRIPALAPTIAASARTCPGSDM